MVFGDPAALAELNAITHRLSGEIDRQAAGVSGGRMPWLRR